MSSTKRVKRTGFLAMLGLCKIGESNATLREAELLAIFKEHGDCIKEMIKEGHSSNDRLEQLRIAAYASGSVDTLTVLAQKILKDN